MKKNILKFPTLIITCTIFAACATPQTIDESKNSTKKSVEHHIKSETSGKTKRAEYTPGVASLVQNSSSEKNRKNEIVCKREVKTGTKIPVRVCRTRAEIEKDREKAQRELDKTQSNQKFRNPHRNN